MRAGAKTETCIVAYLAFIGSPALIRSHHLGAYIAISAAFPFLIYWLTLRHCITHLEPTLFVVVRISHNTCWSRRSTAPLFVAYLASRGGRGLA
jgi:hypothetical protein